MKFLNDVVFNAQAIASVNSAAIDCSQMVTVSLQASFTDAAAAGTIKLQASNDHTNAGNLPTFTPTNWSDIPTATATSAAGATVLIAATNVCYQFIRVVWTRTAGAGTFTATLKTVNY